MAEPTVSRARIGHLLTSLWVGGLERFVLNLRDVLPRNSFDLTVYSWTGDDHWRSEFEVHGIPVRAIGGPHRFTSVLAPIQMASAWARLSRKLRQDRIQILHTHDFFPSLMGRTASIVAGVPHRVMTLHNLYEWWPTWAYRANRLLSSRTDAVTCVSESVKNYFLDREKLPPERYRTILNGVDETRFRPDAEARRRIRAELGIGEDDILVGSVGSITTRKAQHLLVQAASRLKERGIPVQVRIWGANDANPQHAEQQVLRQISEFGLSESIRILPPRPDIEGIYNAMDVHCMTSMAEGLSLASVEAVLCGTLCVYSDIGPFREVVEDGRTGYLFRSGDCEHLAAVLGDAIGNPARARAMRLAGRELGLERFGLARMGRDYEALYRGLVPA
jgi:glycosyltransferase involved in cell wall biosynthesis